MSPTSGKVLVVDLDGTLVRSDLLHESFWSAFSQDWKSPLLCAAALWRGRAALKQHLADCSEVTVSTLPYNQIVIARLQAWRQAGGRTALVTASDQQLAQAVADHLGLFDEVHGSDGLTNLKGSNKASFLQERFGAAGFIYMGDSWADLPVWAHASEAVTVNAPESLRQRTESICPVVEHLADEPDSSGLLMRSRPYIKALRPHQWLKNALVFVPMLAAHRTDTDIVLNSVLAFVCFCLVASSVYILNDLLDLSADRSHPRKRLRPLASGRVPIAHASALALALLVAGFALALLTAGSFLLVILIYYLLTVAYSLAIKRLIVIDICALAALYTLRIVAGGAATGIEISIWLLAFSIFFFLSLAAVKRQAELVDSVTRGALSVNGRGYQTDDLPIVSMISISAGYVCVLVMALYVNSPAVTRLYAHPEALWGVCVVLLYWITRMVMVAHRGQMHDDPLVYAVTDRASQICLILIAAFAIGGTLL